MSTYTTVYVSMKHTQLGAQPDKALIVHGSEQEQAYFHKEISNKPSTDGSWTIVVSSTTKQLDYILDDDPGFLAFLERERKEKEETEEMQATFDRNRREQREREEQRRLERNAKSKTTREENKKKRAKKE
jgi:hypothetical protein